MALRKALAWISGTLREIAAGDTLDPAQLGTGTRDGTKFLRDDGAFVNPPTSAVTGLDAALASLVPNTRTVNGKALSANITLGLASADFANQGTTSTVLHGNAAGSPAFGPVATGDLANSAVTYAKIQNISATDKLLGRSTAGAGLVEEIACTAAGRALLDDADASAQRTTLGLAIGIDVQAYDGDLAAIAALSGTSGLLRKTAANTWSLDTATYLTGNQSITLSGDVSGSGTTAITVTLATVTAAKGGTGQSGYTLGDLLYASGASALSKLAGNITTTKQFLSQTGNGSASAAPVWSALVKSDVGLGSVENTALSTWAGSANLTTLGTVATGTWSATAIAVAKGGTGATDAAAARTNLGLAIGSNVQAYDADLAAIASLTSAADRLPYFTGAGTAALATFTAAGRALLDDADAATQRTTLGLGSLATQSGTFSGTSSGTNTGDQTITLTGNVTGSGTGSFATTIANSAVTYAKIQNISATDKLLGRSTAGAGVVEEITCTAAGRALLDDASASAQRTTLGLAIGTDVQAYDGDLAAIAALSGTSGVLRKTAANTWSLDTTDNVVVGAVLFVAQNTAPTGYLKCNGAAVSRTTYAALFTAIGTTFGTGDGSTTFNVPELRGEFVRGWDDSRGVDSGRTFGSAQGDLIEDHQHASFEGAPGFGAAAAGGGATGILAGAATVFTTAVTTANTAGGETRPRNLALLAVIRY